MLDEEAAHSLFAAIAQRALLDLKDGSVSTGCREEAAEFLTMHFPGWRNWPIAKPRRRPARAQPVPKS